MNKFMRWIALAVMMGALAAPAAPGAESPSVLLQKGIFAEETEGDLDTAIKIYEQIAAEATANRGVVAQAQYRLAVCHQKKGNKDRAVALLNDLLRQFPSETVLSQKARELLGQLGQAPSSSITIRQLPLRAREVYSFSPDGRYVAYQPEDRSDIAICETATGKTWTVVQRAPEDGSVVFAPDGRRIAYVLSSGIQIANIDGSEAKQVFPFKNDSGLWIYEWSRKGERLIVLAWETKGVAVGVLDIEAGTIKQLKSWTPPSLFWGLGRICLASDGRYLAYRVGAGAENRRKVCVIDLESGMETSLIEKEVGDVVGWSTGDTKLLFTSNRTGVPGLWAIPVREGKPAGEPELVKANIGDISPLGLARDGSFCYTEPKGGMDVYVAAVDFQTGKVSDPPRRVTDRFRGKQSLPVWSKDGQKLMLAAQWQRQFVAVSIASGEPQDYPVGDTFSGWLQQFAWSRDGSFLLIQTLRTGVAHGIHRYDLATGATETLVTTMNTAIPGHWLCHPRLSPDGGSFYYMRRNFLKGEGEKTEYKDSILRRSLHSGDEEIVYASPGMLYTWWPYELSPDGERLAVVTTDQVTTKDFAVALKVRGVRGGETREVIRLEPRVGVNSLAWTPDGKRLVYTIGTPSRDQGASQPGGIWSVALDSGQAVELNLSEPDIRDIATHPDGRQIAFRAGLKSLTHVWVMEGVIPESATPTTRTP
ncbi:MAG: tetratricopeptide repeat protein [Verrucomicrobia bacterium]|nr:tetratricopeptide repeat protein [Verrucomicrobiota bacterium]